MRRISSTVFCDSVSRVSHTHRRVVPSKKESNPCVFHVPLKRLGPHAGIGFDSQSRLRAEASRIHCGQINVSGKIQAICRDVGYSEALYCGAGRKTYSLMFSHSSSPPAPQRSIHSSLKPYCALIPETCARLSRTLVLCAEQPAGKNIPRSS